MHCAPQVRCNANSRKYPVAMTIPIKDMAQLTGTIVTSVFDGILKPPLFPNMKIGNDFQAHRLLARQAELLETRLFEAFLRFLEAPFLGSLRLREPS